MVQVPLLSGIYGKAPADVVRSVPINMEPIAVQGDGSGSGISKGYLRLIPGIRAVMSSAGPDRGGYVWNGAHYRVQGASLVRVDRTTVTVLGNVGSDGKAVTFAEGFERIAIASAGKLYYYNGTALIQVTDPDLGTALAVTWSDGYFLTTDGSFIVATELNDPTSIDPLKYGSSEADPDPIVTLLALRGELFALNRYSIEKFINAGTSGFPYQRSRGSQIPKGCVGAQAFTVFADSFAFCGSARNETPAIYLAGPGQADKISERELDSKLADLSDAQLAAVELEAVNARGLYQLMIHLPSETWCYHWTTSKLLGIPTWSKMAGGPMVGAPFPARHFTLAQGEWWCASAAKLGVLDPEEATLFGEPLAFQFDTPLVYNASAGAVGHEAELVSTGLAGLAASQVALSYTDDGVTWSQERFAQVAGGVRRTVWRRLGRIRHWRGFRFRGIAKAPLSFSRLEAEAEPLNG